MHALVLDDNEIVRTLLSKYITTCGHCCTSCSDPDTAFQVYQDNRFTHIFTDIYLDRIKSSIQEGHSFIKMIRMYEKDSMLEQCFIIAFSSDASLEDKSIAAGATRFLVKPICKEMVSEILNRQQQPQT